MITKKREWGKDILGNWHFHCNIEAKNKRWGIFFNWRPKTFILHFLISISSYGLQIEFGFWFNIVFMLYFFGKKPKR